LVNLVEDWESIEKYTRQLEYYTKVGSYQLRKSNDGMEIKVRVGKFGYVNKSKDPEDPELIKIEAFCTVEGFYKIQGCIPDEFFYA
jgi:hypothetical protein